MLLRTQINRYFSICSPLKDFREIMFTTLKKNQQRIVNNISRRGVNFSLYVLKAFNDNQLSPKLRNQLINNLSNSTQKITIQNVEFIKTRLPNQVAVHKLFENPEKQFTNQKTFKINNVNIETFEVDEAFKIDYTKYNKLMFEKSSHLFTQQNSEGQQDLLVRFSGKQLNQFIRGVISQERLFYDQEKDEFLFKFNEKLLKQYESNVLFKYVMKSQKYPLELNMIDLPHPFIMEELCQKKSVMELEDILEAANIFNLISKIKQTNNPQIDCPKCSKDLDFPSTPDGYYSVLGRDSDFFSENKVNYIISQIHDLTKRSPKQNILLVLSNEYAPVLRDALKYYQDTGKQQGRYLTLDSLKKQIIDRNMSLQKQADTQIPMRKSVITQLLFQANPHAILEYYKSMGQQVGRKYSQILQQYDIKLTIDDLDQQAGNKLQQFFETRQPCQLLQLIFGNQQQFKQTAYTQETIKKIFTRLDHQTNQTTNKIGKIKLNKDL